MPLRDIYGLSLPGPPPDGQAPPEPQDAVGACAWSDDGLLAFSQNSNKPAGQVRCNVCLFHAREGSRAPALRSLWAEARRCFVGCPNPRSG
jgi:hypothetical protein